MNHPAASLRPASRRAFTLVEMMVTVGIIALLLGILLVGLRSALGSGNRTREISNLRQLYYAWQMYSTSNAEQILPGRIDENVQQLWRVKWRDARGNDVPRSDAVDYPWRLAAYTEFSWEIFAGYRPDPIEELAEVPVATVAREPAFGYNSIYVGGEWTATSPTGPARLRFDSIAQPGFNNLVARTQGAILRPDQQVIFAASTRRTPGLYKGAGYELAPGASGVRPPFVAEQAVWRLGLGGDPNIEVVVTGDVPFTRYGQAVATLLGDGSAQPLSLGELSDMRRWSNQADTRGWTHPAE
ncbi:MAG TPA: prepilin-type N-terminal cleavage/methylation domain-containing protein [Phycisphaerales bacterium]|nr:prepilin-type N-terminal cleavage/methylation domain-containing protein [Phycisphaerales bacterium]HMP37741.1 prepilin-type N-terminal cleavage/methylation domain-containing protein [Phycisphaerales bacterium]